MGLVVGLIVGAFGAAYFVYGKRREKISFIVSGIALCVYPYLSDSPFVLIALGALFLAFPFWVKYYTDWDF